jgi:HEAT repeat protein
MDVLSEIADAARIMPAIMRMMRHPNPHLRSKAVKMIGRGNRSSKWVQSRLGDADPRVRANAVESLWGVDTPEARALLNGAVTDSHHRVAANALLGLHHLGEPSVPAIVVKMAAHESARFRAAAAWVMGETGDSRFTDALRHLITEADAAVRRRAFAALARIKAAHGQPPTGGQAAPAPEAAVGVPAAATPAAGVAAPAEPGAVSPAP